MRARSLLVLFALGASACTFLFPLDEPDAGSPNVGAGADAASDTAAAESATSDAANAATDASSVPLMPYPAEVLADKPVLYLRFGEKTGPTARDETQQRSPTYGGEAKLGAKGAILDDPDTAATFTGAATSTVVIPPGLDFPGTAPFTIEVWALQRTPNMFGWAVDHQVYGAGRNGWALRFSDKLLAFERWADNNETGVGSPIPLMNGKYQHIVAAYDGTDAMLYVDGSMAQSSPSPTAMHPMTTTWAAGSQNCTCGTANFAGTLDELAIYDKALPAARVLAHYRASGR
jgi:hypothetical protein